VKVNKTTWEGNKRMGSEKRYWLCKLVDSKWLSIPVIGNCIWHLHMFACPYAYPRMNLEALKSRIRSILFDCLDFVIDLIHRD